MTKNELISLVEAFYRKKYLNHHIRVSDSMPRSDLVIEIFTNKDSLSDQIVVHVRYEEKTIDTWVDYERMFFDADELKFFDMLGFQLESKITEKYDQRIEDWIYDES